MTSSEGSTSSTGECSSDVSAPRVDWEVDGIDRVTGRVTGHVMADDGAPEGLTYALTEQIDPGLGTVEVDHGTGRWSFSPSQGSRLSAFVAAGRSVVEFCVAATRGPVTRTVAVSAPVDPAEAAVTDTIDVGGGLIYGMATAGDRLYVLNGSGALGDNGFVNVIDVSTNTVRGSIEAGSTPFDLVVGGDTLYVSNVDDGTVSVVDLLSGSVSHVIDVGAEPQGLAVSGDRLYVANGVGSVSVIDLDTNTAIAEIPTAADPFGVVVEGDRLYVTDYGGRIVSVIDVLTNGAVDTGGTTSGDCGRGFGGHAYFAAVVGGRLYVANSTTDSLTVVDGDVSAVVDLNPATSAVDSIPVGASPVDVVVSGDRLYVGNLSSGTVEVLDTGTNLIVETIESGIRPGLLAMSPDGRTIYAADVMGGTVRVITSVHAALRPHSGQDAGVSV
jgi:YVTN family beta-propeller protein